MAQKIEWLTNIFGRVERLVKHVNGQTIYSANQYKGGNEYTLIAPDSGLGNFVFFVVDEPETLDYYRGDRTHFKTPFSLVVWVDMRTIPSGENRNTEAVKQEIVRFLNDELRLRYGRMYVNRIFNRAESIFKGFTLDEIDNQFLMQPYCGWRFEGEIEFNDTCAAKPVPPVIEPYIAGHIIDGASTYTFKVNNQDIIVPVGADGNWKWEIDKVLTGTNKFPNKCDFIKVNAKGQKINLKSSFYTNNTTERFECNANVISGNTAFANENLDSKLKSLELIIDSDCTELQYLARGCNSLEKLILKGGTSNVTNFNVLCRYCTSLKEVFIDCIGENVANMSNWFANTDSVKSMNFNTILKSFNVGTLSKLTAQSVINIFNAVAADNLTFTFHPTVGVMIDAALQDPTNYIYQAYWAADARGYHINYVY